MRKNPLITTNRMDFAVEPSEYVDTTDDEFMMAFALRNYFDDGRSLADPRYVKWVAKLWTAVDQVLDFEYMPLHLCTQDDLARFNGKSAEIEK